MVASRKLTLITQVLTIVGTGLSLTACSLVPGANNSSNAPVERSREKPLDTPSLEQLAAKARMAKVQPGAQAALAQRDLAQRDDEDESAAGSGKRPQLPRIAGNTIATGKPAQPVKTNADARIAAQRLLNRSRSDSSNPQMADSGAGQGSARPVTYRMDPPSPQGQGQNGAAQYGYGQPQYGQVSSNEPPVASYPRNPSARFEMPQQAAQGSAFQPPDLAPGSASRQATDPKAVMEAIERMRSRQAVQPAKEQVAFQTASTDTTGSIASSNGSSSDPQPNGPMTFVQFDRESATLSDIGRKSVSTMLQPHLKAVKAKVYLTAGLGGEGQAYNRLLLANQHAQVVAEQIPSGFEVIRRFEPGLPNESVRLFVVR